MKQKTIVIVFTSAIILLGMKVSSASAATYFMRADGTATSKATAIGPASDKSKCMNVATHNSQTFSPGDIIKLSHEGGDFDTYWPPIVIPSSGTSESYISYDGDDGSGTHAVIGTKKTYNTEWTETVSGSHVWGKEFVPDNPRRIWIDDEEYFKAEPKPDVVKRWDWSKVDSRLYVYHDSPVAPTNVRGSVNTYSSGWTETVSGSHVWYKTTVTENPVRIWIDDVEYPEAEPKPDAINRWAWSATDGKLYVFKDSSSAPTNVFGPGSNGIGAIEKNYVRFSNLKFRFMKSQSMQFKGSDYLIIENCDMGENSGGMGIQILNNKESKGTTTGGIIRNNTIDTRYAVKYNWQCEGDVQDGIILQDGTNDWEVYNNYMSNWGHMNIYLWNENPAYSINNVKIHDNFLTAPNVGWGRGFGADAQFGKSEGVEIYNNFVYDTPIRCQLSMPNIKVHNNLIVGTRGRKDCITPNALGEGIAIGHLSYGSQNMQIYNNTIAGCAHWGLQLADDTTEIKNNIISNNLLFDNGKDTTNAVCAELWIPKSEKVNTNTIKNNLIFRPGNSNVVNYRGATSYSNNAVSYMESNASNGDIISGNINVDPLMVDLNGSKAIDYKLQPSSPAIDAGADVGLTADFEGTLVPQGAAPDIGAFEYHSGASAYRNADINQDSLINITDLGIIMSDFEKNSANAQNPRSDINTDGNVNVVDLGILMSEWK
jgi:hypothetical protein